MEYVIVILVLIPAAIATVASTLTQSILFESFREWVSDLDINRYIHGFLVGITHCTYCLSHWLAFLAAIMVSSSIINWLLLSFAFVALSAIYELVIIKLLKEIDHE